MDTLATFAAAMLTMLFVSCVQLIVLYCVVSALYTARPAARIVAWFTADKPQRVSAG